MAGHTLISRGLDGERGWVHLWSNLSSKAHSKAAVGRGMTSCPELLQIVTQTGQEAGRELEQEERQSRFRDMLLGKMIACEKDGSTRS